jgi:hypothetical protein
VVHKLGPESLDEPARWAMTWRAYRRKQQARAAAGANRR